MSTSTPTVLSTGHRFLEAPRWHEGALYASDFFSQQVLRWDPETHVTTEVCHVEQMPAGLAWDPEGRLHVVSMLDRRLLRLGPDGLTEVANLFEHMDWHANDLVIDASGRAYVGNFGWDEGSDPKIQMTSLLRVDPDGSIHVAAEDLVCPNGMSILPDGRTLLVNETFAARVTAFDIDPADGSLSGRRVWARFADDPPETLPDVLALGVILPDGMALDAEGALWLGDCRGAGSARVAEGGEILDFVSTGEHAAFAVALSDEPTPALYLCGNIPYGKGDWTTHSEGTMYRREVEVPRAGRP